MNDTFLYQYRRAPRPAFSEALYAQLSAVDARQQQPVFSLSLSPLRQMVKSMTIMAAALVVVCAVSPQARRQFVEFGKG